MVYTKSAILAAALSITVLATPAAARQDQSGARIAMRPDGPSWEEIQKMYPPEVLKAIRRDIEEELEGRSPRNLGPFTHGHPPFMGHGPVMISREPEDGDLEARELDARGKGKGYRPKKKGPGRRPNGRRPKRPFRGKPGRGRPGRGRPGRGRPGRGKPGRPFRGRPRPHGHPHKGKGKMPHGNPKMHKPMKPAVMPRPGGQQPILPGQTKQPVMAPAVMPPSGGAPPNGAPNAPLNGPPDMPEGSPAEGSDETSGGVPPEESTGDEGALSGEPGPNGPPAPPNQKPGTPPQPPMKKPAGAKRELGGFAGFLSRRGYTSLNELD